MAYDERRGVMVLFGGVYGAYPYGDTWEWDSQKWSLRSLDGPPSQSGAKMAHDTGRGVTVLVGNGGTWEWDGGRWLLRDEFPPSVYSHAMTYDTVRGVTLLFGSFYDPSLDYGYTAAFSWDGETWQVQQMGGPPYPGWPTTGMAFDAGRGVAVLWTGVETWEWDGSAWSLRYTGGPLYPGDLAYDTRRGVIVLHGGGSGLYGAEDADGGVAKYQSVGETWEWDGAAWVLRVADGPKRQRHAIAYDQRRGAAVIFGGVDSPASFAGSQRFDETWEWDGHSWTQVTPQQGIDSRRGVVAYDRGRGVIVLHGHPHDSAPTWEWSDERGWTYRASNGPRWTGMVLAFDERRGQTLLAGAWGNGNSDYGTWAWDGGSWMKVGPIPRDSFGHAVAYDAARGVTVLFGGGWPELDPRTWAWDGASWSVIAETGPSPREFPLMTYDRLRKVVVLLGGGTGTEGFTDTWEWDGGEWTLRATEGPEVGYGCAITYDEHLRVTLLRCGGVAQTWQWDGTTWSALNAMTPVNDLLTGMVYDPIRQATLLVGAVARYGTPSYAWELAPHAAPADSDSDCDVDLVDLAVLQRCFGQEIRGPACHAFRSRGSKEVNRIDYDVLYKSWSGPR